MTERFTASNGWEVNEDGDLLRPSPGGMYAQAASPYMVAAVEYGRHLERTERDAELGRWRSKKHPDYVVYPKTENMILVFEESTGEATTFVRRVTNGSSAKHEVAREWFEAQKPPKPWLSAVHGEAWVIVFEGHERVAVVDDGYFVWAGGDDGYPLDYELITAGRRIWPEPEEADHE